MIGNRKLALWTMIVAVGAGAAIAATPQQMIEARQKGYKEIGRATKAIMDNLHSSSPSLPAVRTNAQTVARLAPQITSWFPPGTGPEAGVKTSASPAIWQQGATFKKDAGDLLAASLALDAAAASGDLARTQAAAAAMGGACKACHMSFRQKES